MGTDAPCPRVDRASSARRVPIRTAAVSFGVVVTCAVTSILPPAVQAQVRIEGRIVEAGTDAGLAGATVRLDGGPTIAANIQGRFRLSQVAPGQHILTAWAYGYATRDVTLQVRADTSLVIELQPSPLPLPPLVVEGRTVTVRGEVFERSTDRRLMNVEVQVDSREETRTDVFGRFEIGEVAAGPPFRMSVRGFGFLPVEAIVSAFQDTALVFELEPDSVAQRMIDVQVRRLEERAEPLRQLVMPVLDRDFLLKRGTATALDLIRERYGNRLERIDCLLIDDVQHTIPRSESILATNRRPWWERLQELSHYLAPEIERIEVLEVGAVPPGQMLRVYTRAFIREMVDGKVELEEPLYVRMAGPGGPYCR